MMIRLRKWIPSEWRIILRKNSTHSLKLHKTMHKTDREADKLFLNLNVIGDGSWGTGKSILISTQESKYLVNCGEATQRLLLNNYFDMNIRHVLLTKCSVENTCGLSAFSLSLGSLGGSKDQGSSNAVFLHSVNEAVLFLRYSSSMADTKSCDWKFVDPTMKPYVSHSLSISTFAATGLQGPISRTQMVRNTCFAFHFQTCYGLSNLNVLLLPKELRESSSAMLSLLQGQSVTLKDGGVVRPEDVVCPHAANPSILVLECPSVELADAFAEHEELLQSVRLRMHNGYLTLVTYLVPQEMLDQPAFRRLVSTIHEAAQSTALPGVPLPQHLVVDGSSGGQNFHMSVECQRLLHNVDPHLFPVLCESTSLSKKPQYLPQSTDEPIFPVPLVLAEPRLQFHCLPHSQFCFRQLSVHASTEAIMSSKDKATLKTIRAKIAETRRGLPRVRPFPQLVFLGTSSSKTTHFRNVSSTLLRLSDESSILVDCGENTMFQLAAAFGVAGAKEILRSLKLVLITHMHSDHVLGIVPLLLARRRAFQDAPSTFKNEDDISSGPILPILAQHSMATLLWKYDSTFATHLLTKDHLLMTMSDSSVQQLMQRQAQGLSLQRFYPQFQRIQDELGLQIRPVLVDHIGGSSAYIISGRFREENDSVGEPWRIVFSGDCRPSEALAQETGECDLLVHEATYRNVRFQTALAVKHSTVDEALQVARQMKARYTILTHFSASMRGHSTLQVYVPNVGSAVDFLRVRLDELPLIPHLTSAYQVIFSLLGKRIKFSKKQ